ncbi:MAG: UbiA family prenyltransferase [Candidatus Thermoplasmatota archaeon]|nr:UbiA family prenyltransferase [Candidatus Thermoplasmatota archaeon]
MGSRKSFFTSPLKFLVHWRSLPPYEMISYIFMFVSVPMLAYGIHLYDMNIIRVIIFTVITLYTGFFAALIWNDITDADIDSVAHPDRPIPSGRISKKNFFAIAFFFSALVLFFAFLVSPICLIIVCIAALFVTFHDRYLKKRVKIPAYSEIFTPVQWVVVAVFGFFAIWTTFPRGSPVSIDLAFLGTINTNKDAIIQMIALVLFTYFTVSAHDIAEGIVDAEGDKKHGVRTYATSFGEKNAARVSFVWFLISGILGVILFYTTILSFVFLVLFIILWLYIMFYSYKLLKSDKKDIKKIGAIVGRKGFDYFLFSYNLIFLDVLIQVIISNFY